MKTIYLLLISILISQNLYSQSPPNSSFIGIFETECPFDSTVFINQTSFWLIYQTLNGKWNGEIDSSRCISVEEVGNDLEIALHQIDPEKPLFIKSLMNDANKDFLESNTLHYPAFVIRLSDDAIINLNEDCENDLCTGLTVGIEIPDSTGFETDLRIYKSTATQASSKVRAEMCIATEKFDENYLKEFVFKVTFINQDLDDGWLRLRYVYNEEFPTVWEDYRVYDLPIAESLYDGMSYNATLYDFSLYGGNMLLMYTGTTYPSSEHISFVEAHLLSNKPTQETINIYINEYETLVYQPFTQLRGGLTEGSDSLRHIVNLINNGANLCMYGIIDFAFEGPTHYIHNGGQVEFHGATSCMIFKNGGTLNVGENTTFHYGNGGEGMLAISEGSTINIGKGGTLVIDNHMVLKSNGNKENQQVFMELNPGCALRFDENAKLSHVGLNPEMRLNVYMNGGVLDDHLLMEAERQLINKIYPEPNKQNNFKISPNPTIGPLKVSMVLKNKGDFNFQIIDINGKIIQSFNKSAQKGFNEFNLDLNEIPNGLYFLRVESHELVASQKFIKM